MKQVTLPLDLSAKKTRKQVFLDQMDRVVPWAEVIELIAPYYPEGLKGRSSHSGPRGVSLAIKISMASLSRFMSYRPARLKRSQSLRKDFA